MHRHTHHFAYTSTYIIKINIDIDPSRPPRTKAPTEPSALGAKAAPDLPCAQARMVRTAREHDVIMARNMMSNRTDMQDRYCGDCCDIHPTQSQYKGNHKRGAAGHFVSWL